MRERKKSPPKEAPIVPLPVMPKRPSGVTDTATLMRQIGEARLLNDPPEEGGEDEKPISEESAQASQDA